VEEKKNYSNDSNSPDSIASDSQTSPINAPLGTTQPSQPSFLGIFSAQLAGFIASSIGIGIIAIVFGLTFNEAIVSHRTQSFGLLADYLSFYYVIPVVVIVFGLIALATKNFVYLLYPILAFYLAEDIYYTHINYFFGGYIPLLEPDKHPGFNAYFTAIVISYLTIHASVKPITKIIGQVRHPSLDKSQIMLANGIILVIGSIAVLVLSFAGTPLYAHQKKARAAIHVPNTSAIFGEPRYDYQLFYAEKSNSTIYKPYDSVNSSFLQKWWDRDTHNACGDKVTYSLHPGQVVAQQFKQTKGGITYAEAVFAGNGSKPPTVERAYKTHLYCFVLDYQKYSLSRKDGDGSNYIGSHPVEQVIDLIAESPKYYPLCTGKQATFYCKSEDIVKNSKLGEVKTKKYNPYAGTPPPVSRSAYKEVGRLTIKEWGISFPLSEEIKDAYYVPYPGDAAHGFSIGLHAYGSDSCFAGLRSTSFSDRRYGFGLATLSRINPKADPNNIGPGYYVAGRNIGEYKYFLEAEPNRCAKSLGKDGTFQATFEKVFDWSELNITPQN
jgi:hypothetical protein